MITITKQNDGVLFTFQDSDKYLYGNGSILVPFNTLSIVADESDMITLKKAASNDVFLSARYDTDFGYRSKDDAIDDLKGMLFTETGGGSESGITSGEVQTMINESISGKADTSVVNQAISEASQAILSVSGDVQTKLATSDFNTYTAATATALGNKADASALTAVANDVTALSGAVDDKQDALVYYSENTEEKFAGIDIQTSGDGMSSDSWINADSENVNFGTWNETDDGEGNVASNDVGFSAGIDALELFVSSDDDRGVLKTSLFVQSTGATMGYSKNTGDVATDANTFISIEEGLIAAEVTENEETTRLNITSNSVTINGNDVATDNYVNNYVKAYYISFATLATQGITDNDWDGIVAAIDAHRPIYAGYPRSDGGIIYYGVECMNKNSGNTEIVMTASDDSQHYFYTFTKNGSNDYSYTVSTKPYVPTITSAVTSGSTDSEIPTAKATYDAIQAGGGGGATYSAGTNISIDTGNTINCTLPIEKLSLTSNEDENYKCLWINPSNVKIWINENRPSTAQLNYLRPAFSFGLNTIKASGHPAAFGQSNTLNGFDTFATGDNNNTNNNYEFATGVYNNSVTGSTASGQTLFSVGNGTSNSARHNAFEIRQNGDIYVNDGTNDVRLQDTITATASNTTALGGLKFVQCTQSEYDVLVSGGTVDSSTIYFITNVVS